MIEITCNDRLGKKVRVKCNEDDTVGDLKKLVAAQTGTRYEKIVLKKWYTIFKDHITLEDYEIHDGMNLELYYQLSRIGSLLSYWMVPLQPNHLMAGCVTCLPNELLNEVLNEGMGDPSQIARALVVVEEGKLYISGRRPAATKEALINAGITLVINAAAGAIPDYFPDDFTYHNINVKDEKEEDLASHFNIVSELIRREGERGGRALVHCQAGVS
eukprot:Ihof_evm7s85 gene=Ihof_evmTU7s85